jgi:ATP-dependent RNA helicase RhlE
LTFQDFGFEPALSDSLQAMGYKTPTPIQQEAIPVIGTGVDLIACAQTGTGKTAAYLLPTLNNILKKDADKRALSALVIAPTRELALQIDQLVEGFSYFTGISSIAIYGGGDGQAFVQQKRAMEAGVEIIIATPGRLIALLQTGQINLKTIDHLILDEADRMLDMGFHEDLMTIFGHLPEKRQNLLFSATMPPKIRQLSKKLLKEPKEISIAIAKPAEGILQQAYLANDRIKGQLLKHLLAQGGYESIVIFASTKDLVKQLPGELRKLNLSAKAFHSDLTQVEREDIMNQFKAKKLPILIGTDIISRGIDVDGIDLVINYDTPRDPEDYVHRIGRTARAATTGTAITFINEGDQRRFGNIEQLIGRTIEKLPLPEQFGKSFEYNPKAKIPNEGRSNHKNKPKRNDRPFNTSSKEPVKAALSTEASSNGEQIAKKKKPWFKKKGPKPNSTLTS